MEFYSVHGGFSTNNVNEDPEVLVPLTALKEAERGGKIGKLDDYYYVTTGNLTILKEARKMGREIVEQLKMDGIRQLSWLPHEEAVRVAVQRWLMKWRSPAYQQHLSPT